MKKTKFEGQTTIFKTWCVLDDNFIKTSSITIKKNSMIICINQISLLKGVQKKHFSCSN